MILDKYVEVGISSNKQYYLDLGYKIPTRISKLGKDTTPKGIKINVKVEDLPRNSHSKISVKCDCCDKAQKITYQSYNVIVEKFGNYVCGKCRNQHQKITM